MKERFMKSYRESIENGLNSVQEKLCFLYQAQNFYAHVLSKYYIAISYIFLYRKLTFSLNAHKKKRSNLLYVDYDELTSGPIMKP